MSFSFFRRAGLFALAGAMLLPQAQALSNVSHWALESVTAAQEAGLETSALASVDAQGNITRAEFCGVVVNTYKAVSGKTVFASAKNPFRDCDDPSVIAAYELGLVNGRGEGVFDPDSTIERQDLCVMLNNVLTAAELEAPAIEGASCIESYPDTDAIYGYAVDAMVTMVDYAIVNGISTGGAPTVLAPNGTTTREQALIMAERFCQAFKPAPAPEPVLPPVQDDTMPDFPSNDSAAIPNFGMTTEDKMTLVYGFGGQQYQTAEEAAAHMVEIEVPVWRLRSDGTKLSDTAYLEVNQALAPIYRAVFEEIYNGPEQFPIKNVGCYSWRPGEHSQGTAIDINWEENMETTINEDGSLTPTTGSHWLPYEDPYSIPEGGDVYNAFTKYGFTWGGNAWSSKRDYMHFSFFGR